MTAIALLLALLVLAVAPWAHIPAPASTLLPLSVGAPELSAWLVVLSLAATVLSSAAIRRAKRRRGIARLALALSLAGLALPIAVLAQIPAGLRRMDTEWQRVFSTPAADLLSPTESAVLRPHPFTWREMFFGLKIPTVDITRGVPLRTVNGVSLTVDIYRPSHGRIVPTVIQIYGGGWRAGAPGDNSELAQSLAASGFGVYAIDYRHAPSFTWPAQLDDVLEGIRWVVSHSLQYKTDPMRIALIGRSAGAQLAMRASQDATAPKIRAVVTIYGPVDLADGYRSPPTPDPLDIRQIERQFLGGTPDDRPEAYADASPITRAGQPHPPVLVITAGRDHIVDPRFGPMLHNALLQSGTSMFLHLPWADHGFDFVPFGPSSQIALYYTQRFLTETLR